MITKINKLINKYTDNELELVAVKQNDCAIGDHEFDCGCADFISGANFILEELKKLAEDKTIIESKLTDFVNAQQSMPAEFKKVVNENFWELAEEDQSRMEGYKQYKKLRSEGHRPGCAIDMVELYAPCRCGVDKDNI